MKTIMSHMTIPEIVPNIETIEEYYQRNGLVFNEAKFNESKKQDSADAETVFYRQMGYYSQ